MAHKFSDHLDFWYFSFVYFTIHYPTLWKDKKIKNFNKKMLQTSVKVDKVYTNNWFKSQLVI